MRQKTKTELFFNIKEQLNVLPKCERYIMEDVENYKDLKGDLAFFINKFESIKEQLGKSSWLNVQWYHGERFCYSYYEVMDWIKAIYSIADKMNYCIYSPNGYYFIKSK